LLEMALVENIQRSDLDSIEIALSYQRLIEEIQLTQEELSKRVGKNRSTVTNYLRLLKLDPIIQTGIRDGFLTMGHGRALINIFDHDKQLEIYKNIIQQNLSVRQTEELVRRAKDGKENTKKTPEEKLLPEVISSSQKFINDFFGQKVEIKMTGSNKGKITIPFHSEEDFLRIKKLLG